MPHREERDFIVHLHLSAEFGEDYEGDDDGFAWAAAFDGELRPRLLSALHAVLRSAPGWRTVPAPRGRSEDRGVDIEVQRVISD